MIKSTWLPVRYGKEIMYKGRQWQAELYQNLPLGCCSHTAPSRTSEVADRSIAVCIDVLTPLQEDMREQGEVTAFVWTTGSKYLLSLCWRGDRKGVVLRASPEPFPSPWTSGCMLSTALHPLGLLASKGVKEGDRQDRGSSKMKVLKYTKCNTLEKV